MKKLLLFFTLFLCLQSLEAANIVPATPENPLASQVLIPVGKNRMISLEEFVSLTPKDFKKLTGEKMRLVKKIQFKLSQRYVRKQIQKDGTVDIAQFNRGGFFSGWKWHWGGFALGLVVVLGPIIALFFKDEHKWDRFWTAASVSLTILSIATILAVI